MEPLVRFRQSIDRLNDKEFGIFHNKWISLLNRDIITSLIFNHFYKNKTQNNNYNLNIIMNTIADIIKQRKKQKSKDNHNSKKICIHKPMIKLHKLPSELIGEISSYLQLREYTNFEGTNRQIYISCNNPSRLLYLLFEPTNTNIRNKYPFIKHLSCSVEQIIVYMKQHSNNNSFNRLNELSLVFTEEDMDELVQNNNLINLKNITTLNCFDCNINTDLIDICQFVSHFPNVQNLYFNDITFTENNMNDNTLSKLLPRLRIFGASNCDHYTTNKIINLYSHQLESLVIHDQNSSNIDTHSAFPNLSELSLCLTSTNTINNMLNQTNILRRVGMNIIQNNLSDEELESVIIKLIETQHLLEYIGFDISYNNWNTVANIITNAMNKINGIKKKEFRIKCHIMETQQINITQTKLSMNGLLNVINKLITTDFMINVTFYGNDGMDNEKMPSIPLDNEQAKDDMVKSFNDKYVCIHELDNENLCQRFIISNKNCTICGYKERWINDD